METEEELGLKLVKKGQEMGFEAAIEEMDLKIEYMDENLPSDFKSGAIWLCKEVKKYYDERYKTYTK